MPVCLSELLVVLGLAATVAGTLLAGLAPARADVEKRWRSGYVQSLERAINQTDDVRSGP